jgi:alpha-tubulin suppressor-like RCC1 family protein
MQSATDDLPRSLNPAVRPVKPTVSRALKSGLSLLTTAVLAGALATTALATPGAVTWGNGTTLGNGTSPTESTTYVPVSLISEVTSVSAGTTFDLALLADGTVRSWGANTSDQLGDGAGNARQWPGPVPSLTEVTAISAGYEDALALLANGTVQAWGLQPASLGDWTTPQAIEGLSGPVTAISAGAEDPELKRAADRGVHNLALLSNGTVEAWGNNEHGQLGDGNTTNSYLPVPVTGLTEVTAISAGGGQSLALLKNGTVMAWGDNSFGKLGDGKSGKKYAYTDVPVPVQGVTGAIAVAAGGEDSLALLSNGTVEAWGNNNAGELGTTPSPGSSLPAEVPNLTGVTAISAGAAQPGGDKDHNLALLGNGTVLAWGSNSRGELGNGTRTNSYTPVEVTGLTDVTAISAGFEDSLAAGPPVPVITAVNPETGPTGGGAPVTVEGFNLGGATAVEFGPHEAGGITSDSPTAVVAVSPPSRPRKVEVTVTTPFGTTGTSPADHYRYEPETALELGRCLKVAKGTGQYGTSKCSEPEAGGEWEWTPGVTNTGFKIQTGKKNKEAITLEDAKGKIVECKGATAGGGQYSGPVSATDVTIAFTGCATGSSKKAPKCTSPGAQAGELVTTELTGEIGFEQKELNNAALELVPTDEGQPFLTFNCGTEAIEVTGGVFGALAPVDSPDSPSFNLTYSSNNGNQHITQFEGGAHRSLEVSIEGTPFQRVALTAGLAIISEEDLELNTTI